MVILNKRHAICRDFFISENFDNFDKNKIIETVQKKN